MLDVANALFLTNNGLANSQLSTIRPLPTSLTVFVRLWCRHFLRKCVVFRVVTNPHGRLIVCMVRTTPAADWSVFGDVPLSGKC